jgi:hypothetical protein
MSEKLATNLQVLKKTRKKPQLGDIFVFQLEPLPDRFFFGRVVKTDTKIGFIGNEINNIILIYIYNATSNDKHNIPELKLEDLMFPPEGINSLPWSRGYFETVRSGENDPKDVYPRHCFKSCSRKGVYYDEYANRLDEPFEPCGEWGMVGYGTIDRAVSRLMGIPLVS